MVRSLWVAPVSGPMVRGAVITSALGLGAQLMSVALQLVFAALFGSSPTTDAYFAALAFPAFVSAVLVAAVPVVVIPVIVDRRALAGREDGDIVSSSVVNLAALVVGSLVLAGIAFSDEIVHLSAPGLSPAEHALAVRLAIVLWPSAAASALAVLLTALWQVDLRFGWPAAVPLVGTAVNLLLLVVLVPPIGILGAALAWTGSAFVEVVLLIPVIRRRWRPRLALAHPGVRGVVLAIWPLLLANVLIQASTVWERYLGSLLPPGQLSQITYASRIVASVSVLLSAGPAAVLLPRLAEVAATGDRLRLGKAIERGLRSMWLLVAPVGVLLFVLAEPAVELLFQRGAFTPKDSQAVAALIRVYGLALVPGMLAVVTSKGLYALKATRLVAGLGAIEGLAYLGYTAWLASIFGALGIALGFAVFAALSLVWQVVYLRRATRWPSLGGLGPFVLPASAAALAGIVAIETSRLVTAALPALVMGGVAGGASYVLILLSGRGLHAFRQRPKR